MVGHPSLECRFETEIIYKIILRPLHVATREGKIYADSLARQDIYDKIYTRPLLITIVHLFSPPAAVSSDAFTYARLYERVLGTIIHLVNCSTAILSARQLSASIVIQAHNSFIWPFDIRVT